MTKEQKVKKQLKMAIINQQAFEVMRDHGVSGLPNEVGGLLLGKPCLNSEGDFLVWVWYAVRGICKSGRAEVTIDSKTYEKAWIVMDQYEQRGEILVVVGYYHTHPDFGVFMSGFDQEEMVAKWPQLYNIAVVLDPRRGVWGAFGYSISGDEGRIVRVPCSLFSGRQKSYQLGEVSYDFALKSERINWTLGR
jgi:proteasome lid subunit RPN8/RPN11